MEFRILGPVEAWVSGRRVPLDGAKLHTVLAALLLAEGRPIPDFRMGYLLWGDHPPTTPEAQICTYVSRLRRRLPGGGLRLLRLGRAYAMETGRWDVDRQQFETKVEHGLKMYRNGDLKGAERYFRDALSLWRGPALCDVSWHLSGAELPRLEERRMATLEHHIDVRSALGMHRELVPELTRLVSEEPLRERFRAQLMIALYRCGRPADALQVYQDGRRTFDNALGTAPGPELQKIHQAVLMGDPELEVGLSAWTGPDGPRPPAGRSVVRI